MENSDLRDYFTRNKFERLFNKKMRSKIKTHFSESHYMIEVLVVSHQLTRIVFISSNI